MRIIERFRHSFSCSGRSNPIVPMRHIVSQLMPCTKIVIRHYDPIVSIIADALESVRPHRATDNYSTQRVIDRDRL